MSNYGVTHCDVSSQQPTNKMACNITLKATGHLHCFPPDNIKSIEGLTVYFNSYSGQERRVVRCVRHDELECDNESGFDCTLTDPQHATITVPESFGEQSGSFRCQIAGVDLSEMKRCPWPPQGRVLVYKFQNGGLFVEIASLSLKPWCCAKPFRTSATLPAVLLLKEKTLLSHHNLDLKTLESKAVRLRLRTKKTHMAWTVARARNAFPLCSHDDNSKVIAGVVLSCLAVIILILVAFLLYKKRKRLGMQSCFSAHEDGDIPKSRHGSFERISGKCCLSVPNEGETTPAVSSDTFQKENGLPEKDGSHRPLIIING